MITQLTCCGWRTDVWLSGIQILECLAVHLEGGVRIVDYRLRQPEDLAITGCIRGLADLNQALKLALGNVVQHHARLSGIVRRPSSGEQVRCPGLDARHARELPAFRGLS